MHLRESVIVRADAETVWPLVADPQLHGRWNAKVVSVRRSADGPVRLGEHFEMTYRMSGRDRPGRVQVLECDPPRRLVFFHQTADKSGEKTVRETYELHPSCDGIELIQDIDMSQAGIPWVFRLLIRFVHRFGTSSGEQPLEMLKRIVEGAATAQEHADSK